MNNNVKMDRGPVIFTSDVSLPKDDKSASEVNKSQLGNWQDYEGTAMLTMLQRKEELKSNGQNTKVSRPKSIWSTTNQPPWDIYPEHLVDIN